MKLHELLRLVLVTSDNYSWKLNTIIANSIMLYEILDVPECSRKGQLVYYAGIGESIRFVCHVNAYPKSNLSFNWTFSRSTEVTVTKSDQDLV